MINTIDTRKMNMHEKYEYLKKLFDDDFETKIGLLCGFIDSVECYLDGYDYEGMSIDEMIADFEHAYYYTLDKDFTKQEFLQVAYEYGYKRKQRLFCNY